MRRQDITEDGVRRGVRAPAAVPAARRRGESDERVTYFEALTALAYLWFADKPVELGVFEVGMGGRGTPRTSSRATSPCSRRSRSTIRSSGPTVNEVAGEKAGIIKPGKVAVEPRAGCRRARGDRGAMRRGGRRAEARVPRLGARGPAARRWAASRSAVRGCTRTYDDLFLPMFGEHAARNAAAAIVAFESLVERAAATRRRPGRRSPACGGPGGWRSVARQPTIMLDGAHNPAGGRGARRGAPRVLHVGPTAPGDLGEREQGPGRDRRPSSRPLADVAYAARNESERSGDAIPIAERLGAEGKPRDGARERGRGARCRRARPPARPISSS